jgi:NodT family efflux transporter outer membrane factor (OMF) lipoprotein
MTMAHRRMPDPLTNYRPNGTGLCLVRLACCGAVLALGGCMVGPRYRTPTSPTSAAFKEAPQDIPVPSGAAWQPGQPGDALLKGDWWRLYQDPALNALEVQVDAANQTLIAAEANFRAARAAIGFAQARQVPTLDAGLGARTVRESSVQPYYPTSLFPSNNGWGDFSLPLDLDYEIDLWGRIRRGVAASRARAQESAAEMETIRLSLHAELATDYFGLRAADGEEKLLDDTIGAYEAALALTQARYDGGLALAGDVAQARTQLDQTRVERADVEIQRTQLEHAIAVLAGKPPAALTIARAPIQVRPPNLPALPAILPSTLLERRPDIAAAERRMAAANEQIGIARAAYYPALSLKMLVGMEGINAANWFTWPSRFWAVGSSLSEAVFDGGRRAAASDEARANYDATVADYRQATLRAFQQVEDNLAATRILEAEQQRQHQATASAVETLDMFSARYERGLDLYLQVVTAQTAALANQRNDIDLIRRRLVANVLLIKALGGGWDRPRLTGGASRTEG